MIGTLRSLQESFRHRWLANILTPYLKSCRTVLDIGAASGRLAERLGRKQPRLNLIGVEVLPSSQPCIPMVQANGKRLPFASGTFDCVMMVDVLHHDSCPRGLLEEAGRIARDRVLIKDHYWTTKLDLAFLRCADYIGNRLYGVKLPYVFLKLESWHSLFKSTGLRIARSSRFRFNAMDPCKHVIFDLRT